MDINIGVSIPEQAFELAKDVYGDIAKLGAQIAGQAIAEDVKPSTC